jgi:hypothetical protein
VSPSTGLGLSWRSSLNEFPPPPAPRQAHLGAFVALGLVYTSPPGDLFTRVRGETARKGLLKEWLGGKVPSMRKAYQTDLSDAEWSYLEPHLPTPKAPGRPRLHTLREIL